MRNGLFAAFLLVAASPGLAQVTPPAVQAAPPQMEVVTLEQAVERASKNPEAIEALKKQELATTWYGPEASNEAFLANFKKMSQYVDLLR